MMDWQNMKDDARIWIYQSDRIFSEEERILIEHKTSDFVNEWTSHGSKMAASMATFHNAFVVIFADEAQSNASGCSIDSSVHFIQSLGKELSIDFFNRMNLAIRKENEIELVHVNDLISRLTNNDFSESDLCFNNLISTKAQLTDEWQIPISASWVAQRLKTS